MLRQSILIVAVATTFTAAQAQDDIYSRQPAKSRTTVLTASDSLNENIINVKTSRAELERLAKDNPTMAVRTAARFLKRSANADYASIGFAAAGGIVGAVGACQSDIDNARPCYWAASGLALASLVSRVFAIYYKSKSASILSSVTITPTTVRMTF